MELIHWLNISAVLGHVIHLTHEFVVASLAKCHMSLRVVSKEQVIILGVGLNPLLVIRVVKQLVLAIGAEVL